MSRNGLLPGQGLMVGLRATSRLDLIGDWFLSFSQPNSFTYQGALILPGAFEGI